MATRNRVIYQSEAVYVSQDASYSGHLTGTSTTAGAAGWEPNIMDLNRIQSANYSFNITRQDVNQFGELAAIDRIITDTPTVSMDMSYVLANFTNEYRLGFTVAQSGAAASTLTSCIGGLIDSSTNAYQKDYFILTTKEGADANSLTTTGKYESIIGLGNGFLTTYSTEASVGGLPTVSVGVEAMNMNFHTIPSLYDVAYNASSNNGFLMNSAAMSGVSGHNPAINPTDGTSVDKKIVLPVATGNASGAGAGLISSLRPGDITISLGKDDTDGISSSTGGGTWDIAGGDIVDAHIQSYTLGFDLSRTPIQKLGTRFAFARPVDFPITATLSVDAVLADLTTGSISDLINCDSTYSARVAMMDPTTCGTSTKNPVCIYIMKGLKIDSESFSSSIGDNKNITLDFSCQVGGPNQKGVGVFMSGFHNPDMP